LGSAADAALAAAAGATDPANGHADAWGGWRLPLICGFRRQPGRWPSTVTGRRFHVSSSGGDIA
jgi:hypothetical protein